MATQAPAPMSAMQIAAMDASTRNAYFNSLPADQRSAQLAAYRTYQQMSNRDYMRNTVRKEAVCPQSSGGALSQVYSAGAALPFTIPSAQNAFCEGILITMNLVVTFATGTSAIYAATAGAPYSLIDTVLVQYNGQQIRLRPYIIRELAKMQGALRKPWADAPLAGGNIATLTSYTTSGAVPVSGSSQTVTLEFYIPFNALHPQDVRGLLPIMGGETSAQVIVTCAPQALGPDPILNSWSVVSGTGHAITFSGSSTVAVTAVYRDGTSYLSPTLRGLDLTGLGTVQYNIDVPLTGITASSIYRQKIAIMNELHYVLLTIVDGQQSSKFSTLPNLQVLEADKDSIGANSFWKFGTGTNLSVNEYFSFLRNTMYGNDLSEGIAPLVYAETYNQSDASQLGGTHALNTTVTGWTDFHYGLQLGAIGSVAGITPRVEAHVVYVNQAGLVPA